MKILHVPFCFYPDPVGGTEVYVEALAQQQQRAGLQVVIAAPGDHNTTSTHNTLSVRHYAIDPTIADVSDLYGAGDAEGAENFSRLLGDEQPNIVHLHAFTRGVSLRVAREARQRHIPLVLTYHTPTVSCLRGTLLRRGTEICDGRLDIRRCTACQLQHLGITQPLDSLLSLIPPSVSRLPGLSRRSGGLWTGLRMPELVRHYHHSVRSLFSEVDSVVALCTWVKDLLLLNGVPEDKIAMSRHGLPDIGQFAVAPSDPPRPPNDPVRLVYLGRIDPVKGLDLIVDAFRALPSAAVELDIYGTVQLGSEAYRDAIASRAAQDPRIRLKPALPRDALGAALVTYDFLVVPSQWLETGPLVVLEAFAAGLPVIGSDLGGIAELVEQDRNGLLVEARSSEGWVNVIKRVLGDPGLRGRLRAGVTPPRSMNDVARDMAALYTQLQADMES